MSEISHWVVRWLCHDLATPIASVMTASELLDDVKPDAEINELIQSGAVRLTGRLRLVRLALGAGETAMAGGPLGKLVMAGLDGTSVDWQFSSDATDGMAPLVAGCAMLVADLNRTRALRVTADGVEVLQGCAWPDSVAAVFAGEPPSDNRSAVATMLLTTAARAGKTLSCDGKGLHWA
jgi:signal transduction histidine kinase